MIDFNKAPVVGNELVYMQQAMQNHKLCGDGPFTKKCSELMKEAFKSRHLLLTTSCTHALEMAAHLSGAGEGDEVIMPSYTFVSTADAFVQRGAKIVFVDIRPDTMNIDETKIEAAITERTKAIVPVHYAGVACAMDEILAIAAKYNVKVVEDAAQGVNAWYKGRALGTIGDFGCYSFHETKNYTMGEGGALLFQDDQYRDAAEILREKGTDRSKFFRGQVDKYTWVSYGSSYLPSDLNAAYLYAQLEQMDRINSRRLAIWNYYHESFEELERAGTVTRPTVPDYAVHNAHMYYLKVKDLKTRTALIAWLKEHGVQSVFHYIPLHTSPAGMRYGRFCGEDEYTTRESERLLRLPMYYSLTMEEAQHVVCAVKSFWEQEGAHNGR